MRRLCDIREGDRFSQGNWIVEAVKPELNTQTDGRFYDCKIIQEGSGRLDVTVGMVSGFWVIGETTPSNWQYLGNFNKTDAFIELYNLLDENQSDI